MMSRFLAISLALLLLSGCIAAEPPAFRGEPLQRLARLGESGLFAADPTGRTVAVSKNSLQLFSVESGLTNELSPEEPDFIAWSPTGLVLAAAFPGKGEASSVSLFSATGETLYTAHVPVRLSKLVWSARGDLLLAGYALKRFSFGGNLRQALYRVVVGGVTEMLLSDTTLKPQTVRKIERSLHDFLPVAFSPGADELVYAVLHDPPEFPPYLQLHYMSWVPGHDRLLEKIPLSALRLDWHAEEDSVELLFAATKRSIDLWPMVGEGADLKERPPAAPYRFYSGRLYEGDRLLADWGSRARFQKLPDGRFLVAAQRSLFVGQGLRPLRETPYNKKLWTLRRWRHEGLISARDYLQKSKELKE